MPGMAGIGEQLNRESVNTFTRQVTNTISEDFSPGLNQRTRPLRNDTFGVGVAMQKLEIPGCTGSSHDIEIPIKRMTQIDEHLGESTFMNTPQGAKSI